MKIFLVHIESESPSLFSGKNNDTIPCKSLEVARKTMRNLVSKFLSEAPKTYGMDDVNVRKYIDTDNESMFYFHAIGYGSEYYHIEEKEVLEHPYG